MLPNVHTLTQPQVPTAVQTRAQNILNRHQQRTPAAPVQAQAIQQITQNIQNNQQAAQNVQQQNTGNFKILSSRFQISNTANVIATATTEAEEKNISQLQKASRKALKNHLVSRIARALDVINVATQYNKTRDMQLYQSDYAHELAKSLYHGSRNLFFRMYRGPIQEEYIVDKITSGAVNTVKAIVNAKPSVSQPYFAPSRVNEIDRLVDESVNHVSALKL